MIKIQERTKNMAPYHIKQLENFLALHIGRSPGTPKHGLKLGCMPPRMGHTAERSGLANSRSRKTHYGPLITASPPPPPRRIAYNFALTQCSSLFSFNLHRDIIAAKLLPPSYSIDQNNYFFLFVLKESLSDGGPIRIHCARATYRHSTDD